MPATGSNIVLEVLFIFNNKSANECLSKEAMHSHVERKNENKRLYRKELRGLPDKAKTDEKAKFTR